MQLMLHESVGACDCYDESERSEAPLVRAEATIDDVLLFQPFRNLSSPGSSGFPPRSHSIGSVMVVMGRRKRDGGIQKKLSRRR